MLLGAWLLELANDVGLVLGFWRVAQMQGVTCGVRLRSMQAILGSGSSALAMFHKERERERERERAREREREGRVIIRFGNFEKVKFSF